MNNRRQRSALAKLRCSAHRLKIEIGKYSRFYSEETKRHEQLPREKRTCDTCKDKVEDEHHFLLKCSLNEEILKNFFQKLYTVLTEDIQLWSDTDEIKYFLAQQTNLLQTALGNLFLIHLKNTENRQHTYKMKTNHYSK